MSGKGAKLTIDDAFIPKHIVFTECDKHIEFFIDGESIRVQVWEGKEMKDTKRENFKLGMRIPLYARTAFAQMFTHTLNGESLYKETP